MQGQLGTELLEEFRCCEEKESAGVSADGWQDVAVKAVRAESCRFLKRTTC